MTRPVPRPAENGSSGIELPPILPNTGGTSSTALPAKPGTNDPARGGTAGSPGAPGAGGTAAGEPGPRGGDGPPDDGLGKFAPPQPAGQPVQLRPAQLGGRGEVVIYVECRPDVVVVYPARVQIPVESLSHTAPHNKLTQTVTKILAQQQALAKAGGGMARFRLRFLIHPGAERALHQADAALQTVSVPKTSYRLMADDSVARIVAGY